MKLEIRSSKKGRLMELFKGRFSQCNLLIMRKGSFWGGHYHKKTKEFFYLIDGEILLELLSLDQKKKSRKIYRKDDSFTVFPKTIHKINVLQNTKCLVLYSKIFLEKKPDIFYKLSK